MSVSYSHQDPETAVPAAQPVQIPGLRHVDDKRTPGLRRRHTGKSIRVGKRFTPGFVIEDASGKAVRDPETLKRVRKLAIPPAWEDVWICPHANGHIQATGRDARGRKQYRYHARWREERDRTKFSRMVAFGKALPALRRRVDADLKLEGLPQRKVLATVVRLLETTFIRVGNEEYARTNKSFGLTTLKDRHVDFRPGEVRFHFRGKSGVSHQVAVHDPRVARIVRRCRDLPGQELFQYLSEDGKIQTIDSSDVNAYIQEIAGRDFTAKDFRTWAGTVLAATAFKELAAEATKTVKEERPMAIAAGVARGRKPPGRRGGRVPTGPAAASATRAVASALTQVAGAGRRGAGRGASHTGRSTRTAAVHTAARNVVRAPASRRTQKDVVRAIEQVATRLGNTPSVCRKCYVHPAVIASYFDGKLAGALAPAVKQAVTRPAKGRAAAVSSPRGLRPDEAAVLALLERADGKEVTLKGPGAASPRRRRRARPS